MDSGKKIDFPALGDVSETCGDNMKRFGRCRKLMVMDSRQLKKRDISSFRRRPESRVFGPLL
jgi:hypothetical protein